MREARNRVVQLRRFGGPDGLEVVDAPLPTAGRGEVRVRVLASGLEYTDVLIRRHLYPQTMHRRPPFVMGYDVVGEIDQLGDGVSSLQVGDRVADMTVVGSNAAYRTLRADHLTRVPMGLDPALEKAIEEFMAKKRARETKVKDLEAKSAKGGVSGLTATNEIKQMESQDLTEMNRMEITLNAAKKRAATQSGDIALQEKKKKQEDEDKAKRDASRNKLKGMAAQWEKGPSSP